ncbi:MAG TPA: primase alpha helix C-terminal domain-containing protein, partial [Nitrososphaeraceae archaeon]
YKEEFLPKLLADPTVSNEDKEKIKDLLAKPFNPYIRRHSALTEKSTNKEHRYQLIKLIQPISLERKQALDMMRHIDSICVKSGVEYLHKGYKSNKLNLIITSLSIDSTIEICEGERHQTLLSVADSLLLRYRNKGKTEEWLKKFLSEINQKLCHPEPLSDDEIDEIWNSAIEYVNRIISARGAPPQGSKEDGTNLIEYTSEEIKKKYRFAALPSKDYYIIMTAFIQMKEKS